ncbi:MAG TPA: universal stress protein [Flavobacteriales bacterium]|nr:universal stress protein [Flavobacteriales bacterium]HMR25904.1 universal stress protein [Flavobacteriales bacterium]
MKNILAAVDLSPITQEVLRMAGDLARERGATLWIVHVAAPDPDLVGFEPGPQHIRDHRAHELRDEHQELQRLAGERTADGVDARALLVQGPTVATILDQAERLQVELVVLGSHGHGALHRLFVGSVCQQVLAATRTPLLIVPSPASA